MLRGKRKVNMIFINRFIATEELSKLESKFIKLLFLRDYAIHEDKYIFNNFLTDIKRSLK
jgi:hypothetical protein